LVPRTPPLAPGWQSHPALASDCDVALRCLLIATSPCGFRHDSIPAAATSPCGFRHDSIAAAIVTLTELGPLFRQHLVGALRWAARN
jgi:hypothetical protein